MNANQQQRAAKAFAEAWKDRGYEKGETQSFWLSLLRDVFGIEKPEEFIRFEEPVMIENTNFMDAVIPSTHVLIEQKSLGKDLNKPIRQSDGSLLKPIDQAKQYILGLARSEHPQWVITSNFSEFYIYNMERPHSEPDIIRLADLEKEYYRLEFLVKTTDKSIQREMEVSIAAGDIVGILYEKLLAQYEQPVSERNLKDLNVLCVRLVFCLYAEDAGIFGKRNMFHDYLGAFDARHMHGALVDLFRVLNQTEEQRDKYLDEDLAAFPYVNGGLFEQEVEVPRITEEIRELLLTKASGNFDWSEISPTIFGAVFESTLNPDTRRKGGMHYTSIENIHKVIDPLFLDDLRRELEAIQAEPVVNTRQRALKAYQRKLASLTFLDPACGSGNFLTETYLSLRHLENEALKLLLGDQIRIGDELSSPIQVSISQFYGIEINDFAVTVAKTALWIAESQMMKETEHIVLMALEFLPLKTNANIIEGNALRIPWEDVVPKEKLNYIMGNPPFVGASMMSATQKAEAVEIFGKGNRVNSIDYVGAWYYKAAMLMQGTAIKAAFVSTNSITQGEQVAPLWGKLLTDYSINIIFAYPTFKWSSEATEKAAVHCVIIGFFAGSYPGEKKIFTNGSFHFAENINPYLLDAPNILVESNGSPLFGDLRMTAGNKPSDGGNLILSQNERDELIKDEKIKDCIRLYLGSQDFINGGEKRYCIWLKDVSPSVYRSNKFIMNRLEAVRKMRSESTAKPTRALADKPYLFFSTPQTEDTYLCIPEVSSENRLYIPIGFLDGKIIASNKLLIIPRATLYHFGILTSDVHMGWMRTVCGRLKSDYQYSGSIVYNTFPWPIVTEEKKHRIEETAQAILDVRAKFPDATLADLYDKNAMPKLLQSAHQENDRAVMDAYGFVRGHAARTSESACVAELMKLYQAKVEETHDPS